MVIKDKEKPKEKIKIKPGFIEKLECSSPTKLNEIIKEKALINPCLKVDDEYEEERDESDIDNEREHLLDGEIETDPDFYHDEEFEDNESGSIDHKTVLEDTDLTEKIENYLGMPHAGQSDIMTRIAEAQAKDSNFMESLEALMGNKSIFRKNREPFLHIRFYKKGKHIEVCESSEVQRLSLDEDLKKYIPEQYEEAYQLICDINSLNGYLKKLALMVADRQGDFFKADDFLSAVLKLKPFSIDEASKMLGIHKSTCSRLVGDKIVDTKFGHIPLKLFFSGISHRSKGKGGIVSEAKIELLREILASRGKGITDSEIIKSFKEKGIIISPKMIRYYRKKIGVVKKRGKRKGNK